MNKFLVEIVNVILTNLKCVLFPFRKDFFSTI